MTILEEMLIPTDYKVKDFDDMSDVNKVIGFMKFEKAFDIYIDVAEITIESIRQNTLHTKFKEDLLHRNHGLACFLLESIFGDKYIVIDNDHVDLAPFWNEIYKERSVKSEEPGRI